MVRINENLMRVLEYRDKKSKELKRQISLSEAVALWLSESVSAPVVSSGEKQKISAPEVSMYS